MDNLTDKLSAQWKDAVNLVLGLWLVVSPWALAYSGTAAAAQNAWIVGVVVAVAALAALIAFHKWEEWVNTVLAVWLIVSPWLLGFGALQAAVWNQIVVGVLVGIMSIWAAVSADDESLASRG